MNQHHPSCPSNRTKYWIHPFIVTCWEIALLRAPKKMIWRTWFSKTKRFGLEIRQALASLASLSGYTERQLANCHPKPHQYTSSKQQKLKDNIVTLLHRHVHAKINSNENNQKHSFGSQMKGCTNPSHLHKQPNADDLDPQLSTLPIY